ncbi:MAG: efflux RND transporter periplasmic adaptor subunit [Chrysiogenetes bacterium]|nr:efflux RND transporter periplasmic adaptor subunit [Chrysiogenetes bacterium]
MSAETDPKDDIEAKARRLDPELEKDLKILGLGPGGQRAPRPKKRRVSSWMVLLALAVLVGGALWVRKKLEPPKVTLTPVSLREVGLPEVSLTAAGYLVAKRQITVSSKAQGRLIEMAVEENQQVKEGDLIGRIENDEQEAQLRLAEAQLAQARADWERARDLARQNITSEADAEKLRTQYEVARAQRDLAKLSYDNTFIRAPISGTVIEKLRDVGEFLTIGVSATGDPGTAIATLADLSEMRVELEISETEISKIKMGGVALVTPEAMPELRYLADVVEIGAMADRDKSIIPVEVRLRAPDAALKPDMTAKVSFLVSEPEGEIRLAPVVPKSAVRGGAVFVVEDGRAVAKALKLAPTGEYFEVLSGIEEGALIIKEPPADLSAGARVSVGEK